MSTTTDRDGLVLDLPEADYHSGPELSSTGAKTLLRAPALYKWQQEHPWHSDAFDLGSVVHGLVLGTGWPVVVVEADSWRSKAAQDERRAARDAGQVPILLADYERAVRMADAVANHPIAGPLFTGDGHSEVSAFWTDEDTGVRCRARFDRRNPGQIVDLKTAADANPAGFGRAVASFGYDLSTAWYREAHEAVTGERPEFLHVVVEKNAPHLVSVIQLDEEALHIGALKAARAREVFAECTKTGQWPGYDPTVIHPVGLPQWAIYEEMDREEEVFIP